jgi:hypothetical protein
VTYAHWLVLRTGLRTNPGFHCYWACETNTEFKAINFSIACLRDRSLFHSVYFSSSTSSKFKAAHFARFHCQLISYAFLFPTLIPVGEVGTTCIPLWCDIIRQLFLRLAACLTSILVHSGVGANDFKCSRTYGLTCLPKHGGARDKKILVIHSMTDRRRRCLAYEIASQAYWPRSHQAPQFISYHLVFYILKTRT